MKVVNILLMVSLAVQCSLVSAYEIPVSNLPYGESAKSDYAINCRGCHGPSGMNTHSSVPDMNGYIDKFLHVPGGREYLIQVPGISRSALTDLEIAQMLNWLIVTIGRDKHLQDIFTEQEVARVRHLPLGASAAQIRAKLVAAIEYQEAQEKTLTTEHASASYSVLVEEK